MEPRELYQKILILFFRASTGAAQMRACRGAADGSFNPGDAEWLNVDSEALWFKSQLLVREGNKDGLCVIWKVKTKQCPYCFRNQKAGEDAPCVLSAQPSCCLSAGSPPWHRAVVWQNLFHLAQLLS